MTLIALLELSDTWERIATRVMQAALLGLVGYGLVTFELALAINGGLALAITLIPALLRREYGYAMAPGLVLWVTLATFLHSIGTLGPYAWFSWYDNITHGVSSIVVAGLGYASFRAFELHSEEIDVPSTFRAVFIVVFVLAFGVVWEVLEFGTVELARALGMEPPLKVFGLTDIITDFVFNTVGAVLVAVGGTDAVGGLTGFFRRRLDSENG